MRKANVYFHNTLVGTLTEDTGKYYVFRYDDAYFLDPLKPSISLNLPKSKQKHISNYMFPFFSNMVAEGSNLAIQSACYHIHESNILELLNATTPNDTIGGVVVKCI